MENKIEDHLGNFKKFISSSRDKLKDKFKNIFKKEVNNLKDIQDVKLSDNK
jgi:hypothetical protein